MKNHLEYRRFFFLELNFFLKKDEHFNVLLTVKLKNMRNVRMFFELTLEITKSPVIKPETISHVFLICSKRIRNFIGKSPKIRARNYL